MAIAVSAESSADSRNDSSLLVRRWCQLINNQLLVPATHRKESHWLSGSWWTQNCIKKRLIDVTLMCFLWSLWTKKLHCVTLKLHRTLLQSHITAVMHSCEQAPLEAMSFSLSCHSVLPKSCLKSHQWEPSLNYVCFSSKFIYIQYKIAKHNIEVKLQCLKLYWQKARDAGSATMLPPFQGLASGEWN